MDMYVRNQNTYKSNKSLKQPDEFEIEKNYQISLSALQIEENTVLGNGAFAKIFKGFYYGKEVAVKRFDL